MDLTVLLFQFGLGVLLFFVLNWIGKHSYSIGYISISVFARVEEAPAFNFIIRVLTPIIYLIITASILYYFKLDKYVQDFYFVNFYYIAFRLGFNLITGRGLLLNWYRQILYWVSILVLSYFTYTKLIVSRENLLPDFTTLANELWIIILIFLFHVTNNIQLPTKGTERRKANYLISMVNTFERNYGNIIDSKISNDKLKGLIYAILIIENFNRPLVARWIEYFNFFLTGKPHTLGIMQYYSNKYISDEESIELGIEKILKAYKKSVLNMLNDKNAAYYGDSTIQYELANVYNTGTDYSSDVIEMWDQIMVKIYPNTKDKLIEDFPTCEFPTRYQE